MFPKQFITSYKFTKDRSKPGRILEWVKVGEVFISRIVIDPGMTLSNIYNKETNVIMFVEKGRLKSKFVHIETGAARNKYLHKN